MQRIPIEGKFGQGKDGYRLNYIRAKRADTSSAWINSIFLVMNLLILLKIFLLLWIKVACQVLARFWSTYWAVFGCGLADSRFKIDRVAQDEMPVVA